MSRQAGERRAPPPYITLIGPSDAPDDIRALAERAGARIARAGAVLVCGGGAGAMEAACRGAQLAGGTTLGLLPGAERSAGNPYLTIAVPTGMGEMRNALVVRSGDAVLAVGGGYGTLSEIALALKLGKPIAGVGTWSAEFAGAPAAVARCATPEEAVALLMASLGLPNWPVGVD